MALHYLEAEGIVLQDIAGTKKNWQLGKTVFAPFAANDGGYVGADARGYQLLLNYRGPSKYFPTVSVTDVLEDRVSPDWGRDRIILIGNVGGSFQDLYLTPYSNDLRNFPSVLPKTVVPCSKLGRSHGSGCGFCSGLGSVLP